MDLNWLSLLGWAASIIVTVSLLMKDAKKLRAWNLLGATLFVIYGSIRADWPIVLVNAIIWGADLYYLYRYYVIDPKQALHEEVPA